MKKISRNSVIYFIAIFVLGVAVFAALTIKTSNRQNDDLISRGENLYQEFCAQCHGKQLEGQPDWRRRNTEGKLPAPPHDDSGHTWHHPDDLLFGLVKYGLVPPYGPDNYDSDMPAYEQLLSDEEIRAILAFIKSRWSQEKLQIQQAINNDSL